MGSYTSILRELCGSEARFRVLSALYEHPNRAMHLRRLASAAGVDPGNASKLMGRLTRAGLTERVEGELYPKFRARRENPLYNELVALFRRAGDLIDDLVAVANEAAEGSAFVFGSVARDEDRPESDIDVLAISEKSQILIAAAFKPLERKYQRKIRVTAASESDILDSIRKGSGFWIEVLSGPLIALHGEIPNAIRRAISGAGQPGIPPESN